MRKVGVCEGFSRERESVQGVQGVQGGEDHREAKLGAARRRVSLGREVVVQVESRRGCGVKEEKEKEGEEEKGRQRQHRGRAVEGESNRGAQTAACVTCQQ